MKILSVSQTREADAYTISHEPIASIDLMERAAQGLSEKLKSLVPSGTPLVFFCGPGNNGGDGLAMARMLEKDYPVKVFVLESESYSPDFETNLYRLAGQQIPAEKLPDDNVFLKPGEVILDCLYGSGLNRPPEGLAARLIQRLNTFSNLKIAVDIPSGLYGEKEAEGKAILHADITLSVHAPKLNYFFPENYMYVGEWQVVDIGLDKEFVEALPVSTYYLTLQEAGAFVKPRPRFAHKGNFGHALVIAGNKGKYGAAALSAMSCIHSGAGLVTACVPEKAADTVMAHAPEVMLIEEDNEFLTLLPSCDAYDVVAIGPGLGTEPATEKMVGALLKTWSGPLVMDADALNILAQNPTWMEFLPSQTILTPHPGEFDRLAGKSRSGHERVEKQQRMSSRYHCIIVLKGAYTSISFPNGDVWFNTSGNPGMATAGSGDVLTGLLTSLLAQGYDVQDAVLLGVYLHGLAGDLRIKNKKDTEETLTASGLIKGFPQAFAKLKENAGKNPR